MDSKKNAVDIFLAGVEGVKPGNLVRRFVSCDNNLVKIKDLSFHLKEIKNLFVIGAGKASALMAYEMESILGDRINGGHIITRYHHSLPLKYVEITEAGHPVPDLNGIKGTKKILKIAEKAGEDDLVLCLISGGGSALMTDLPDGCSLEDLKILNDLLLKSGANINEMNCIRKHLSKIKGGFLSEVVWPAKIVSLILSDVIGDPLDVIASGPTSPDPTTFSDALYLLRKYNIEQEIPPRIMQVLQKGSKSKLKETPKENSKFFSHTKNLIIGNNFLALEAAKEKAELLGYETQIITSTLEGDVNLVVTHLVEMIKSIRKLGLKKKICLLLGGEPTVKVSGTGLGGRNQHLVLLMSKVMKNLPGITFLSAGTDGSDGPTNAAGAIVDSDAAEKMNILMIENSIENYDSYHFFKNENALVMTGPTHTNVMDMVVILID